MNVFTYDNGNNRLEINEPEILLIKEFKALSDRDKSKNKTRLWKELTYIYLAIDWKSLYNQYSEQERHVEALSDSGITEEEFNDPMFREACRKYKALQESNKSIKMLKAAMNAVDQFIDYFNDIVDLNERDVNGKPVFNAKKVMEEVVDPETVEKTNEWTGESEVTDVFTEASQYELGTVMPKLYGGFGTTLRAYGFDLSAQLSFQLGGKYYDGTYQALMHTSSGTGMAWHRDALNSWSEDNPDTNIPRLDGDTSVGQTAVNNYLISSDYLSVNNVTLGYTFPAKWTSKINIAGLRVYVAGDNLAVLSARKGVDPRYSMGLGSFTSGSGLNSGSYSSMRTITGGVTLTF